MYTPSTPPRRQPSVLSAPGHRYQAETLGKKWLNEGGAPWGTLGNMERRSTDNGSCPQGSVCDESRGKDETGGDVPGDGEHRRDRPQVAHLSEWPRAYHEDGTAGP
jgi:hypothetical protein